MGSILWSLRLPDLDEILPKILLERLEEILLLMLHFSVLMIIAIVESMERELRIRSLREFLWEMVKHGVLFDEIRVLELSFLLIKKESHFLSKKIVDCMMRGYEVILIKIN